MIKVYKFHPDAKIPVKAHREDAGYDLFSIEEVFIPCGKTSMVDIGIAVEVPPGYFLKLTDRSSMAKAGLFVGGGIVDANFTDRIQVILTNLTNIQYRDELGNTIDYGYLIRKGDRIAQMIFQKHENFPLVEVANPIEAPEGTRGNKALGSSGK